LSETAALRLDRWLWHARFVRRREQVAPLIAARRVRLNGQLVARSHQRVREGDVLTLLLGPRLLVVRVVALGERRGPAAEARRLYEEVDPEAGGG